MAYKPVLSPAEVELRLKDPRGLAIARALELEAESIDVSIRINSLERGEAEKRPPLHVCEIEFTSLRWPFLETRRRKLSTEFGPFVAWSYEGRVETQCEPHELPGWLGREEKRLKVRWDRDVTISGSLKRKEPLIFAAWLLSESSTAR